MAGEKKVVDASVVIKWFVNEHGSDAATELRNKHALQYKLTLYDALYVAIAQTFGLPLVTEDAALLKVPNSIQLTKAK